MSSSNRFLTNKEITRLLDGLDLLRKSEYVSLMDIGEVGALADKLSGWISEISIGFDLVQAPSSHLYIDDSDSSVALGGGRKVKQTS